MVAISLNNQRLAELCKSWKISELALFGSVLGDDFDSRSDIDVLVTYAADADWGLFDHQRIEQELSSFFGRQVDLVSKRGVERSRNDLRRQKILQSAKTIYVS